MQIKILAQKTGLSPKTIRYYERVGLMPPPKRGENNYRIYDDTAVERLRFIASARRLDIPIRDIAEILAARDDGIAPCDRVLTALDRQLADVDRRIADMLALRDILREIKEKGTVLPRDDVRGEHCVCYLVKNYQPEGTVVIEQELLLR